MFGEVIDDQVDELDLIRGRHSADQKDPEGLLGGFAVHADPTYPLVGARRRIPSSGAAARPSRAGVPR
jgi:hypothetical protein